MRREFWLKPIDAGQLAIVQGVGYPNPNRSHFRSTEIWQTASDSARFERYGWLGRYFDNTCSGCDPTIGVSIGRQAPQAFSARQPTGVSLDNPQNYRFMAGGRPGPGELGSMEDSFRKLNQPEAELGENSGGTIGSLKGPVRHAGSVLDFIERTALDAQVSSDKIRSIASRVDNLATYPVSQLGNSLKLVAKLIGGGLPTRVFYVSQGGYDGLVAAMSGVLKDASAGLALKAPIFDYKEFERLEHAGWQKYGGQIERLRRELSRVRE